MIARSEIDDTLKSLNSKFNKSVEKKEPIYFAKLAVVEACGWIEAEQDKIILSCARRCFNSGGFRQSCEDKVKANYGFRYAKHFKPLMRHMIGLKGVERVEGKCNDLVLEQLKNELDDLADLRNDLAHTQIKGRILTFDAPSLIISRVNVVYRGLQELENSLKTCGY